ncbi:MAG: YitT family protein [Candidatus Metalachnospira sp.]|nr:YitT family protein [Candidatus Metalachnospira sp.]
MNSTISKAKDVFAVLFGNTLDAFAVAAFILPNGLALSGGTGLAVAANYWFKIPISVFVLVFNVIMFIIGAAVLGKKFAFTTAISTFYYPFILDVFQKLIGDRIITNDVFLNIFFGGLLIGISLGIVVRAGASTGGTDIPPLVLNKLFGISVPVGMYGIGCIILAIQLLFREVDVVLYGFVMIMIYTLVLDKIMVLGKQRIQLQIISSKPDEIKEAIINKVGRGVTVLYGETGYMGEQCRMILSVVSNRQLLKAERLIKSIDPESFVIINSVREVAGKGF